jgi:BirA family biotin operon repressor/biotin-[acetyl-CoA-carboxylase] ligase
VDRLVAEDLVRPGAGIAHSVTVKEKTGSTNDDARGLAESGAAAGTVVIAEEQERGRGRLGRAWHSPAGVNLMFSVVLRPTLPAGKIGLFTIAAGVAMTRAVRGLCGLDARIKWPNDVRVRGKKLAGILAEAGGGTEYVVLGVGVNVNLAAESLPEDLRPIATSLRIETGREWRRTDVFLRAMEELETVMAALESGHSAGVISAWRDLAEAMGRRVRVVTPGGEFAGPAIGIRESGALVIVDDASGREREIVAGDVILI